MSSGHPLPPVIRPEWPAPPGVRALATTRIGGVSQPPFDRLNLGTHVEDDPAAVAVNRRRLVEGQGLPAEPRWLNQVHGTGLADAAQVAGGVDADGSFTTESGVVCAVLTADCLPVLFCDEGGTRVAAAHAGWRGLHAGILEQAVKTFVKPEGVLAWMGPAISQAAFEVGPEVREAFLDADPGAGGAFCPSPAGRWLADIYLLARRRLRAVGVERVFGGGYCTFSEQKRFFSFRRDGRTGRMASLIWMEVKP